MPAQHPITVRETSATAAAASSLILSDDRHPRHQWYSSGMSLIASGGQVADIEIGAFLIAAGNGPEK